MALDSAEKGLYQELKKVFEEQRAGIRIRLQNIYQKGYNGKRKLEAFNSVKLPRKAAIVDKWRQVAIATYLAGFEEMVEADELDVDVKIYKEDEPEIISKAEAIAEYQISNLESKLKLLLQKAYESNLGFLALMVLVNQLFAQFEDPGKTLGMGISYISVWALQKGRWAAIRESGRKIQGKQFVAILDERTCEFCKFMDGKIIYESNPDYYIVSPSFHHFCRCLEIPVYSGEDVEETYERPSDDLIKIGGGLVPF